MSDREYVAMPVLCLSCGFNEDHGVSAEKGLPKVDVCRCPRCSNNAYVLNPLRMQHVIGAMGKEIVRMKLDLMDLQGVYDDE